jgi:hypothetical protein
MASLEGETHKRRNVYGYWRGRFARGRSNEQMKQMGQIRFQW